mmetsp:Transcript_32846/g.96866  ORF Transcript_32846/g.96866 Transcript_32846/m.96866 type:complete len:252 (+) Transcript_32846:465-1220(+)
MDYLTVILIVLSLLPDGPSISAPAQPMLTIPSEVRRSRFPSFVAWAYCLLRPQSAMKLVKDSFGLSVYHMYPSQGSARSSGHSSMVLSNPSRSLVESMDATRFTFAVALNPSSSIFKYSPQTSESINLTENPYLSCASANICIPSATVFPAVFHRFGGPYSIRTFCTRLDSKSLFADGTACSSNPSTSILRQAISLVSSGGIKSEIGRASTMPAAALSPFPESSPRTTFATAPSPSSCPSIPTNSLFPRIA